MERHNGYTTGDKGAKCTKCEDWIPKGEEAVLLEPDRVGENGLEPRAIALHGVLCMDCYDKI